MKPRTQTVAALALMGAGLGALGVGLFIVVGLGMALTVVGGALAGLGLLVGWRK